MSKYLEKEIENESTGVVAVAWIGENLSIDLLNNTASLNEVGYISAKAIAEDKSPVHTGDWFEPDINVLVTSSDLPAGTKVEDIVYQAIVERMVTLDEIPGLDRLNPWKGAIIKEL